jgi:hypothetical protein
MSLIAFGSQPFAQVQFAMARRFEIPCHRASPVRVAELLWHNVIAIL